MSDHDTEPARTRALDLLQLDARLQELLEQAPQQRRAMLAALAASDPQQAQQLQRLLALAIESQTTDLRVEGAGIGIVEARPLLSQLPGYRIGQVIGQGGSATVYEAWRVLGAVEQEVAIKLLSAVLPGEMERARFLAEQQILARLRHPNIATLLDAGVVDGRPYMVLERIDGVPLDAWLEPGVAPVAQVLDLVEQACAALQVAHAHLVIHRDIKPGNVLVTAAGHLKLIDFGIAKQLGDGIGALREATLDGDTPLTLRYASPEQLQGGTIGVGSDVYQVGLLAYRLLTGGWPYGDGRGDELAARLDPHAEPVPPSRRAVARLRQRQLAGDLDAILLRCLRFDPAERYPGIGELRADLARHRAQQPVLARRQTRGYLLRSFLRRHRLAAWTGVLLLALVAVGVGAALSLAARNAEHAGRLDRVLATVTAMLTRANPYNDAPGSVSVSAVVDSASDQLLREEPADPRFHLQMLELLAGLQRDLQNPAREQRLLARAAALATASGAPLPRQAELQAQAIEAQARNGDLDGVLAAAAAFRQRFPGPEPLALLQAEAVLHSDRGDFPRALAALDAAAARLERGAVLQRYDLQAEHANVLARAGRLDEALALERQAARALDPAIPAHRPAWLRHRASVATLLGQLGRYAESAAALGVLHDEARAQLGAGHPRVLELAANTAVMLLESARPGAAWTLLAGIDPAALEQTPPLSQASVRVTRAGAALFSGRAADVLPDLLRSVEQALDVLGPESPRLSYFLERTAWTLFELEQPELAVPFAEQAWRLSGQRRSAVDFLLQLLALRQPVAGRPDPAFASRLATSCDRLQFELLAAYWTGALQARPAATRVPADCSASSAMWLAALGLDWPTQDDNDALREPLRTPLLQRWQALAGGRPAPPAMVLDEADRQRLGALLERLSPIPAPAAAAP